MLIGLDAQFRVSLFDGPVLRKHQERAFFLLPAKGGADRDPWKRQAQWHGRGCPAILARHLGGRVLHSASDGAGGSVFSLKAHPVNDLRINMISVSVGDKIFCKPVIGDAVEQSPKGSPVVYIDEERFNVTISGAFCSLIVDHKV